MRPKLLTSFATKYVTAFLFRVEGSEVKKIWGNDNRYDLRFSTHIDRSRKPGLAPDGSAFQVRAMERETTGASAQRLFT